MEMVSQGLVEQQVYSLSVYHSAVNEYLRTVVGYHRGFIEFIVVCSENKTRSVTHNIDSQTGWRIIEAIKAGAWKKVQDSVKVCRALGIDITEPKKFSELDFVDDGWMTSEVYQLNGYCGVPEYAAWEDGKVILTGRFVEILNVDNVVKRVDVDTLEDLKPFNYPSRFVWRITDDALNKHPESNRLDYRGVVEHVQELYRKRMA